MNQDQVKEKLLLLEGDIEDFDLIFSGKKSRKVDGLYHPEEKEIIIHNRNMSSDNAIIYTAIHEFAHHLQFTRSTVPISVRAHTAQFWETFHSMLRKAESIGVYMSPFGSDHDFLELTRKIREEFIGENGKLMKKFGGLLKKALELCEKHKVSFEDYVDRALQLHRIEAKNILTITAMNLNPDIGYENMKTVSRIREPARREEAVQSFLDGHSPDMVKSRFLGKPRQEQQEEPIILLEREKRRIQRSIATLRSRLDEVESRIDGLKSEG